MSAATDRFVDRFDVILFDLHGTLMFEQDRFDSDQDYYATYRRLGGNRLDATAVRTHIESCLADLLRDYEREDRFNDFPTLAEAFRTYAGVADEDMALCEAVFAEHERGRLPERYLPFLDRLARTHQLGVVSNICARPDSWIAAFDRAGVRHLFRSMVFSSQGREIKPSPVIFRRALTAFDTDARMLFVGDSLRRDIRPARALGLGTAWVAPAGSRDPAADVVIASVLELERITGDE